MAKATGTGHEGEPHRAMGGATLSSLNRAGAGPDRPDAATNREAGSARPAARWNRSHSIARNAAIAPPPAAPPPSTPPGAAEARNGETAAGLRKHFVLDTNVLLHNPNAIFMFDEHEVVIPLPVIEELDKFKTGSDDKGRNARQVIRSIDKLRARGRLFEGVSLNGGGGTLRVDRDDHPIPFALDTDQADNRILAVAHALNQQGLRTIFISKDINVRVKADALGVTVEDFEADRVDTEWLYSGQAELTVPGELIDALYSERQLPIEQIEPHLVAEVDGEPVRLALVANQYTLLRDAQDESHTGLARRLGDTEHLIPIAGPRKPVFGVMARNVQQTMALDLLLDDEIKLVTLLGTAGTGKTLLALAAGMNKVFKEEHFDKLLVARPIMPLGRDIGYLPGDKDEKLVMWMQPIFDNLAYLLSTRGSHMENADSRTTEQRINQLLSGGKLVLEPLTYIRGRSIPHQFMIVDEVQNLTPHEVKTIVSRVGEGTKIILTGDINQIDNPYLDASSNGLSYLIERMKGQALAGHVTLARTERSTLASLAAEIL
jgi:PhoH-like ATPase